MMSSARAQKMQRRKHFLSFGVNAPDQQGERECKTFAQKFKNTIGAAFKLISEMPIRRGLLADLNTANVTVSGCLIPMHGDRAMAALPP